jgi:alpha-galactosidase
VRPLANNIQDEPLWIAVLPEHWSGWTGRPGLSGDRGGRDWSARFETTDVKIDGSSVTNAESRQLVETGLAPVQVSATDPVAQLGCQLRIELVAGGVCSIRNRAS